jgi:hypothetical protein
MNLRTDTSRNRGATLVVALVLCCITLLIMAAALKWSSTNTTLSQRNNEYFRTVAVAEAATEKVLANIMADYKAGGDAAVTNVGKYTSILPTAAENPLYSSYEFNDGKNNKNKIYVENTKPREFRQLSAQYKGLRGYSTSFRVIANAKQTDTLFNIVGAVRQDFEVATIPLFQFAIFYNLDCEINPGPVMDVTGPVHSNGDIFLDPQATLTFHDDVTAAGNIYQNKKPGDPLSRTKGSTVFKAESDSKTSAITLPVGTNNTPEAVRQIVEVPPTGESHTSDMGKERFYNKANMIITVSNNSIKVTSGRHNSFATTISVTNWWKSLNPGAGFISTNTFFNRRENKLVQSLDIDVGKLVLWNQTNNSLRPTLTNGVSGGDVSIIYVADYRTSTLATQPGVRLHNGQTLPPKGLTVVTPTPAYIRGDYNVSDSKKGTLDTADTKPAAVISDAITVLSSQWDDLKADLPLTSRVAGDTTVNAALMAGIVETTDGSYSGGVENFIRFLEKWSDKKLTYSGSLVVMFPSKVATGTWNGTGGSHNIYDPPLRNWAFDQNFRDPVKLPPGTPMARALVRNTWQMIKPNTTTVASN